MTTGNIEWPWRPEDFKNLRDDAARPTQEHAAILAAKCFRGQSGEQFLTYLRGLTLDRALGPEACDSTLRHVEGQRQLVQHICNLVALGWNGPTHSSPTTPDQGAP